MNKLQNYIILALMALLLFSCTKTTAEINDSETELASDNTQSSISGNFGDILMSDGKYKCTIDSGNISSTIYVEGGNYRMESQVSSDMMVHMISKKQQDEKICAFSWNTGTNADKTLIKMCFTPNIESVENNAKPFEWSPDVNVNVNCESYSGAIDFNPPSNMQMMDLTSMTGSVVAVIDI